MHGSGAQLGIARLQNLSTVSSAMATLAEVQQEITNMQKAQEERMTATMSARDTEMKNWMEMLVKTMKGGEGAADGKDKDKDHDKDYNK